VGSARVTACISGADLGFARDAGRARYWRACPGADMGIAGTRASRSGARTTWVRAAAGRGRSSVGRAGAELGCSRAAACGLTAARACRTSGPFVGRASAGRTSSATAGT
jgi:hypothetical protein